MGRASCILLLAVGLATCDYSGDDLTDGPGVYICESNIGRPTLSFHSDTLKIQRTGIASGIVTFVDLESGRVWRLHAVEDRDYTCSKMEEK